MKHERAPTTPPPIRRGEYLAYAHVLENHSLWAFSANFQWLKVSKVTSTHHNVSFEPIHMSLWPYVTKIQPDKSHVSKNRCFRKFRPYSVNFLLPNVAETAKRHIYTPNHLVCAHFHVYATILMFRKTAVLGSFGRIRSISDIYTLRPFIWAYSQVSMTFR